MDAARAALERVDSGPLVVKCNGSIHFIRMQDLDRCQADGNYIRLHVGQQQYHIRATMSRLESQLDPSRFVRVHRSTIVNVDRIQELRPTFHGEYLIVLRDTTQLTLSRGYRKRLLRKFF
jgi:two-component system LytT family response regulator